MAKSMQSIVPKMFSDPDFSKANIIYTDFGVNTKLYYADYNPYDVYYQKYVGGLTNGTIKDIKPTS